ncbi:MULTISPECIES: hypothetical protein [unclassified Spiroplasma]|uniref:hypothetical protein n=1 Tax=unclassified Spiroplasma TaxID=2637901 RepID=UPI0020794742|nr:hypothetical protein [Spiroplasma endosymbiont of Lariophagus distinguendus]
MKILKSINKVFEYPNILDLTPGDFYLNSHEYHLATQEVIVILGVLINKEKIENAIKTLNFTWINFKEKVIVYFSIFAYLIIGNEYNDLKSVKINQIKFKDNTLKIKFKETLLTMINKFPRTLHLTNVLGNDNDRANMYAVNAILNIKKGIGYDNFHITLFSVYQSLELKLKHCLRKYIQVEPSASKKKFNFHNLIRLIKLISTTRVESEEMSKILLNLRERLRYFEQINPGGQAARYEAEINHNYFHNLNSYIINEQELLSNFVKALSLLQELYLKLIELYKDDNTKVKMQKKIDLELVKVSGIKIEDDPKKINDKLRNVLDNQIFGNYQELIDLNYNDVAILEFLIRIGFIQYVNDTIEQLL